MKNITHGPLSDVSLQINPGETLCLTGGSGEGMTTLLHIIQGALKPKQGSVTVDSVDLHAAPAPVIQMYRKRTGFVHHDLMLDPLMTVAESIAVPLEIVGTEEETRMMKGEALMVRLGLTAIGHRLVQDISPSQKQMTAIARAVIHEPLLLFLDEPLTHLDETQALTVLQLLQELTEGQRTMVIATKTPHRFGNLKPQAYSVSDGIVAKPSQKIPHAKGSTDTPKVTVKAKKKVKVTGVR